MPPWEAVQEPAGLERLWVFGSGPVPAQPAELLQSDLMRELLAERRKVADFVIIEAPAALNASDCLALAPLVDGILVVADAKHTDRDEVEQVRIQFEQVGGQVVGAVMSNASCRSTHVHPHLTSSSQRPGLTAGPFCCRGPTAGANGRGPAEWPGPSDVALALEVQDDLLRRFFGGEVSVVSITISASAGSS